LFDESAENLRRKAISIKWKGLFGQQKPLSSDFLITGNNPQESAKFDSYK